MYLRVFFPSGRCYAAEMHDPAVPEWPPHPSRVYSALVASAYSDKEGITDKKRQALEWIESLPAPAIKSPFADTSNAPTVYVPPGDSTGSKGLKKNRQFEHGVHRWRQPRHFPSAVILDTPEVLYCWEEDPDPEIFEVLSEITKGVTHIGTSQSMSIVKPYKGKCHVLPTLLPGHSGDCFLRIPSPGRLKELDDVFKQTHGVRRPPPKCEVLSGYCFSKNKSEKPPPRKAEFLILRISSSMHGADTAAYLGRAVRRAVMSVLGDDAPPAVHGHNNVNHIGWIPLPDVGHQHATGRILGIGVMLPYEVSDKDRNEILAGIERVKEVRLPDGRVAHLTPTMPGERLPKALMQNTWTRLSDTWASITPVVLDRPPKKNDQQRILKALFQSLFFAGYPEPQEVRVSAFSPFKGAPPAFRVPAEKPRYHAILRFENPIAGPVIAGRLRYFGVGLFRPL